LTGTAEGAEDNRVYSMAPKMGLSRTPGACRESPTSDGVVAWSRGRRKIDLANWRRAVRTEKRSTAPAAPLRTPQDARKATRKRRVMVGLGVVVLAVLLVSVCRRRRGAGGFIA